MNDYDDDLGFNDDDFDNDFNDDLGFDDNTYSNDPDDLGFDDEVFESGFDEDTDDYPYVKVQGEFSENSDYVENEQGQTYNSEEVDQWQGYISSVQQLVDTGELAYEDAETVLNGVYAEYIQQNDLNNAIAEGIAPSDISDEAWQMYADNFGKMSIKDAVEKTDPFLQGLFEGVEVNHKRIKKNSKKTSRRDPFLEGFDSY